jgi:hypothetical protein
MGECQLSEGERLAAGVFAVATTTIIGLAKEMSDGRMDKNDILYNGIGSGAALFSIKVFGF